MTKLVAHTIETVLLTDLIDTHEREMGLKPMALETQLLLERVEAGGHSGEFLADAFISAYRGTAFNRGLNELNSLDAEGFRLFHQILHMKRIKGWSDHALFQIEQQIRLINV